MSSNVSVSSALETYQAEKQACTETQVQPAKCDFVDSAPTVVNSRYRRSGRSFCAYRDDLSPQETPPNALDPNELHLP
jgi:hypothetical protein